jgi:hypothetical protein
MKKILISSLGILMLTGCAGRVWVNPNVSNYQAQRDWQECDYDANRSVQVNYGGSDAAVIGAAFRIAELKSMCMQNKGYHLENRQ